MTYNTKQKELILDTIKNINREFTVKDIYSKLDEKIGLTTIYRFIERLESTHCINKYIGKDNVTYYEYLESCDKDNHFYLKCDCCGSLKHIDCDCIEDLTNHIRKDHNFKLNREHIIINGICEVCNEKN